MKVPKSGEHNPAFSRDPEGATIEHHLQKQLNTQGEANLKLAHKRCNI